MQLKELDVTHNKWLRQLGCNWNLLKTLGVSEKGKLRGEKAEFNQSGSLKRNNPRLNLKRKRANGEIFVSPLILLYPPYFY